MTSNVNYEPITAHVSYQPIPAHGSYQPITAHGSYQPIPAHGSYQPITAHVSFQPDTDGISYQPITGLVLHYNMFFMFFFIFSTPYFLEFCSPNNDNAFLCSFRFQFVLNAPTSPATKVIDDTLTYLNQGTFLIEADSNSSGVFSHLVDELCECLCHLCNRKSSFMVEISVRLKSLRLDHWVYFIDNFITDRYGNRPLS